MEKEEIIKKYGIDIAKLEKEQIKLAKELDIKDKIDFSLADKFGAISNTFIKNKILSAIIVCDKNYEIIDQAYVLEKVKFPYIAGFRAYRELPAMVLAFNKLSERPDVVFVPGQGISHPRLGLASHFSLATQVPTIGVAGSIVDNEIVNKDIMRNNKKVGNVFVSKPQSKPMYISPGNWISLKTSINLVKQFINLPHKLPEPMHLAGKYAREIKKELVV